ncbi:MAG: histidine kinase [Herbaspirillum sp.]|nr:histidine kinase [Herbaspirillum sp.]
MDTKELSREQISAFVDGELSETQVEVVMAALRTEQGQAAWNEYHLVGDAARSDETAIAMSPGFMSKLSARLDAEPAIVAPAGSPNVSGGKQADRLVANGAGGRTAMRRFGIPALALSLAAAIGFMLQPHVQQPAQVASGAEPAATLARDTDVARDPKLDHAIGAHQDLAEQHTSEYGRSAAYNIGADKEADKAADKSANKPVAKPADPGVVK